MQQDYWGGFALRYFWRLLSLFCQIVSPIIKNKTKSGYIYKQN